MIRRILIALSVAAVSALGATGAIMALYAFNLAFVAIFG